MDGNIIYIIFQEEKLTNCTYKLVNKSSVISMTYNQSDVFDYLDYLDIESSQQFSWLNLSKKKFVKFNFYLGGHNESSPAMPIENYVYEFELDVLWQNFTLEIPIAEDGEFKQLYAATYTNGYTKYLVFSDHLHRNFEVEDNIEIEKPDLTLQIDLDGIGLSIMTSDFIRKEFGYLSFEQITMLMI